MNIFLIGPGGVGKSSTGKILAENINYNLVDLDIEFMEHVGHIGSYIELNGYKQYCFKNSELFFSLLNNCIEDTVFILSSGFLVHRGLGELVTKHSKAIKANGISILLLPSRKVDESINIVVKRQMSRGIGLKEINERRKIVERYKKYLKFGDIQIFSHDRPQDIAKAMEKELANCLAL